MREKDHSSADDQTLVRDAQKGDMGAFEELVARHRDKIYARAFSMMRNEEEAIDLSQEAWVKGWQRALCGRIVGWRCVPLEYGQARPPK